MNSTAPFGNEEGGAIRSSSAKDESQSEERPLQLSAELTERPATCGPRGEIRALVCEVSRERERRSNSTDIGELGIKPSSVAITFVDSHLSWRTHGEVQLFSSLFNRAMRDHRVGAVIDAEEHPLSSPETFAPLDLQENGQPAPV
jgi:hypothetical protein